MSDWLVGLVSLASGVAMLLFRRPFARFVIREQNQFWGLGLGPRAERAALVVSSVVGLGFGVVGALALVGLVHFRR